MILGIDSSSVAGNKNPDWRAAKMAGASFAFLRACVGTTVDPQFQREWPRLREAGLVRGAYMFLRWPGRGVPDAEQQAGALVRLLQTADIDNEDFPPTIDVEFGEGGRKATGQEVFQCLDWVDRAWRVLREGLKLDPILYTSARVVRDELASSPRSNWLDCPLWLANYGRIQAGQPPAIGKAFDGVKPPPVPPGWTDPDAWWFHQYQGDAVGFPGFSGKVDLNRFNPTLADRPGFRTNWVNERLRVAGMSTVSYYQQAHSLVADGIVGPRTFARLAWERA